MMSHPVVSNKEVYDAYIEREQSKTMINVSEKVLNMLELPNSYPSTERVRKRLSTQVEKVF